MDYKNELNRVLDNFINNETEKAQVSLHSVVQNKVQDLIRVRPDNLTNDIKTQDKE